MRKSVSLLASETPSESKDEGSKFVKAVNSITAKKKTI